MRVAFLYLFLFFISCESTEKHPDPENDTAKWYFYCFASSLSARTDENVEVDPLVCELKKVREVSEGKDTLAIYFNSFYKDSNNLCTYHPLHLAGVWVIRNKIYLPIYHTVVFDSFANDSVTFAYMAQQEQLLLNKINAAGNNVNSWLSLQVYKKK